MALHGLKWLVVQQIVCAHAAYSDFVEPSHFSDHATCGNVGKMVENISTGMIFGRAESLDQADI